jgi:hypothetical protein
MPAISYNKKWLSVSEMLASLRVGSDDAKATICNAIADNMVRLSFVVPQLTAAGPSAHIRFELKDAGADAGAKCLAGIPVQIPARLPVERFADLAQPIAWWWPWFFGAVSQRADLAGFIWALAELELLAADVKKVLGGAAPLTSEARAEIASDYEGAIEWLRAKLASAKLATGKDIVKHDTAQRACRRYFGVSMTGFDKRVWVPARIKAGLEPLAKPGRKPKIKPRGHS